MSARNGLRAGAALPGGHPGRHQSAPVIGPACAQDLPGVHALLAAASLPTGSVEAAVDQMLVARVGGRVVGSAIVERHGRDGLLRSVAVDAPLRGSGLGTRLVETAMERSRAAGLESLYLLTETAAGWFPRLGFEIVERDGVPAPVRASPEFAALCPASAIAMTARLAPSGALSPRDQ